VPRISIKQPFGDPEQLERIQISRQLVELRRDVPLPATLDDLVVGEWDLPALHGLFTELEFQVLVDKVKIGCRRPTTWSWCRRPRSTRSRASPRRPTRGSSCAATRSPSSPPRRARPAGWRSPSSSRPSGPSAPAWSPP